MDISVNDFDEFKISAFSKLKCVSPYITNTTIGPDSVMVEDDVTDTPQLETSGNLCSKKRVLREANVIDKYLAEKEQQRQENVQEAISNHVKRMLEFSKNQNLNLKKQIVKQQQNSMDELQQQELQILQTLEQHDKAMYLKQQQLLSYYSELAEKRKQNNREIKEREMRRKKINMLIDKIKRDQIEFRNIFQQILNAMKEYKGRTELKVILGEIPTQLKLLPDKMDKIVNSCAEGKINEDESCKSNELVQEISSLLSVVQHKLSEAMAAEQTKSQSLTKVEAKPISLQQPTATPIHSMSSITNPLIQNKNKDEKPKEDNKFCSKSSMQTYSAIQEFMEKYVKQFEQLENDTACKQFRFNCKKAVNIPVNSISAANVHHLLDKYNRLKNLLSGKTVEVVNVTVCASQHPQGISFCTNLLAKKFVLQSDLTISSNPESAFCYAAVIVALWNDNSDFGQLILGYFYKQCPYLIPLYPPYVAGASEKEFYLSRGYNYVDDVIEQQDKFLKRMTGIMRLFAAIIITKPKKGQQKHPYGLAKGWEWLSCFVNLEPQPDVTATMLHAFLETAGSTMQNTYCKMFSKLMDYICKVYLPLIQKIDSGGPVTRLEVLLQDYQNRRVFDAPPGSLPSNFW